MVQWPAEAGFWLSRSYQYFPAGTVHLCVVDPGARAEPQALVAVRDGHAFLAPDNGVLAPVVGARDDIDVISVDLERIAEVGVTFVPGIFHGRDLFAPLAAELASGRCQPEDLGEAAGEITPSWVDDPEVSEDEIRGVVLTVDGFGNLITNIGGELLDGRKHLVVHAGSQEIKLKKTYSESAPGDYLALVNSFGVLEVARSEMSAADGLGIGRGSPVSVRSTD